MIAQKNIKIFNLVSHKINEIYGCENVFSKKQSVYFSFKQLYFIRQMALDILKKHIPEPDIIKLTGLTKYAVQNAWFYYKDVGLLRLQTLINQTLK